MMDRNPNDRIDVDGKPENTDRQLNMEPGSVAEGEDIGGGLRAKPADGLEGADGRIHHGEDIGSGIEARPADGLEGADGRAERGEDIGSGIRARPAGEQDPGNPLV